MFQSIVFDLDGTLIDSAPDVRHALNKLLVSMGRRPLSLAKVQDLVGEGAKVLMERAFLETGAAIAPDDIEPVIARYIDFYRECPADHTLIYTGVVDELKRLKALGIKMGICTNKPYEMSVLVVEQLGLAGYFDGMTGGDNVPRRKPDGQHIKDTLTLIGGNIAKSVMIGDSVTDVAAARDCGIPVIAVAHGYAKMPPERLGADLVIDGFEEMRKALEFLAVKVKA